MGMGMGGGVGGGLKGKSGAMKHLQGLPAHAGSGPQATAANSRLHGIGAHK